MIESFDELVISRSELIYVLNALQAKHVVGVDIKEFELTPSGLESLLQKAEKNLIASNLVTIDPSTQTRQINPILIGMIGALAFRSAAFVLVRGVRDKGQQLFIFNVYQDIIVEHTQPQQSLHRLAVLEDLDAFFSRIDQLVPLHSVITKDRPQFVMSQTAFQDIQQNKGLQDYEIAQTLVKAGLSKDLTLPFIQAFQNPIITFSLAILSCEQDTAVDASSATIFADENSAWGVWGGVEGIRETDCLVFPTGTNDIKVAFADWLDVEIT